MGMLMNIKGKTIIVLFSMVCLFMTTKLLAAEFTTSDNRDDDGINGEYKFAIISDKENKNKISSIIVGHTHMATFIDVEGVPIILSASAISHHNSHWNNYYDDRLKVKVTTQWLYDIRSTYWLQLRLDSKNDNLSLDYIKMADDSVACSILLNKNEMNKYQMADNCFATTAR
jgi:hypothetical protein